jgi:Arm DNA-binding domain
MLAKITKRTVDALKPGITDLFLWDTELKGFGLKVTPGGNKVYILQYRKGGRVRADGAGVTNRWHPTKRVTRRPLAAAKCCRSKGSDGLSRSLSEARRSRGAALGKCFAAGAPSSPWRSVACLRRLPAGSASVESASVERAEVSCVSTRPSRRC